MPQPLKIGLLYLPEVSLFHFAVPQMIFGGDFDENRFDLVTIQADTSQNPMITCDGGLALAEQADMLIVAGWHDLDTPPSAPLRQALISAYRRGATLVGLCYGTYVLAYCGLLDGKKAATHWAAEADFVRRFPKVRLDTNALYVDDGNIITSAGTAADIDCCLYIVRKFHGARAANKIARMMVVPPHREGGQAQFIDSPIPPATKDSQLNRLLAKIRQNPTACYRIDELAATLAMSRRTFTRHFQKATGGSFTQWLIHLRLQNSLEWLENSTLGIEQIAEKTGFHSAVSFREHFKKRYHVSPQQWRRTFAGE